jgi:hypothetical protein
MAETHMAVEVRQLLGQTELVQVVVGLLLKDKEEMEEMGL